MPAVRAWLAVITVGLVGCSQELPFIDAGTPVPNHCAPTPADVGFGAVAPFARSDRTVRLRNPTANTVIVELGTVEAPFSASLSGRLRLAAGQAREMTFTVAPTDTLSHMTRVSFRGGIDCPIGSFLLTAESTGGVTVTPGTLDFGALPLGGTRVLSLLLVNSASTPALVTRATVRPSSTFAANFAQLEVPSGASVALSVQARATTAGFVVGTLDLGGPQFSTVVDLVVHGGVPVARLEPASLDVALAPFFPDVPQASFVERRVVLRNAAANTLPASANLRLLEPTASVMALEGTSAELCVGEWDGGACALPQPLTSTFASLSGGESLVVPLRVMPGGSGPRRWLVTFSTNDPVTPRPQLLVTATAARPDPCELTVTPPQLDLGVHAPGEGATAELTFENVGSSACVLDALRLMVGPRDGGAGVDGGGVPVQTSASLWLDGGFEQLTLAAGARHVATLAASARFPGTTEGAVEYHVLRADSGVSRVPFEMTVR